MSKALLVWYFIYGSLFWGAEYAYQPYLVSHISSLGATASITGIILGGWGFFQLLLRIPIGILSDKINNQKIFMVVGNGFFVVSTFLLMVTDSIVGVLISRLLSGIASATWICFIVIFQDECKERGSVYGSAKLFTITNTGRLIGIGASALIMIFGTLQMIFVMSFLMTVAVFLMSPKLKDTKSRRVLPIRESFKIILSDKNLRIAVAIIFCYQMVQFGTVFAYSNQLVEENIGDWAIGIVSVVSLIAMVLCPALCVDKMARRFGLKKCMHIALALCGLYCLLMPHAHNIVVMLIIAFVGCCGFGASYTINMGYAVMTVPEEVKTLAMGVFQTAVGGAVLLGPIFVGYVLEYSNMTVVFYTQFALVAVSALLVQILMKKEY